MGRIRGSALLVSASAAGAALGFFLCSIVLYPFSSGILAKIEWGDAAAWFSGLGTFAAVIVALRLAKEGEADRSAERARLASIFAGTAIEDIYAVIAHLQHHLLAVRDGRGLSAYRSNLYALSTSKCPALTICTENLRFFDVETAVQIGRAHGQLLAVVALTSENYSLSEGREGGPPQHAIDNLVETTELAISKLFGVFEKFVSLSGTTRPYDPRKHGEDTYQERKRRTAYIAVGPSPGNAVKGQESQ